MSKPVRVKNADQSESLRESGQSLLKLTLQESVIPLPLALEEDKVTTPQVDADVRNPFTAFTLRLGREPKVAERLGQEDVYDFLSDGLRIVLPG